MKTIDAGRSAFDGFHQDIEKLKNKRLALIQTSGSARYTKPEDREKADKLDNKIRELENKAFGRR